MRTLQIPIPGQILEISRIVLGTTFFGTVVEKSMAFSLLDEYFRLGGRCVDTARAYGQSEDFGVSLSEKLLGEWIASRGVRNEIMLSTKGCHTSHMARQHRLSPENLLRDIEDSFRCLGVEHIDLYFLHRDDESVPVEPIIDTLDSLVKSGKITAFGATNWTMDRILAANAYAERSGKTPFAVSQIQWGIASCTAEAWGDPNLVFMDAAIKKQYLDAELPLIAYSAQARGLFSKYLSDPETAQTAQNARFFTPENLRKAGAIQAICQESKVSPAAVTVAYVTSNELNAGALISASKIEQLRDTMSAADFMLTPAQIQMLDNA